MSCKHSNVKIYDGKHRCMQCFDTFVHLDELEKAVGMIVYIRQEIASMIQDEFDLYAPDQPPVGRQEFMDALKEVAGAD